MEAVHEEKKNGLNIKIFRDESPEAPDAWGDNNLFLVGYHRSFSVDAPTGKNERALFSKEELVAYFQKRKFDYNFDFKAYHVFPLSAYIHSGVRLYMGTHKVCQWDSCQVGAVLVAKEEWKSRKKAEQIAQGLIENWNDYLSGNVYFLRVEDEEGTDLETCGGYYGDYDGKNGALAEARSIVDRLTNNGKTDHTGQLLFEFAAA